ncbi:hypothetical protein D3C71_1742750 [compost metagenome]
MRAYCGWKASDSSPRSPLVVVSVLISRKGVASKLPFCTTRMRPARSRMNKRLSPAGAVRKMGAFRPVATSCRVRASGAPAA